MTEKRFARIKKTVEKRQKSLTLVLENVHDPHNVSAIFRTADAVGIDRIYLVYNTNKFPKIGRVSSASANKWIQKIKYDNIADCYGELKSKDFMIYSTYMGDAGESNSLYELDLTVKTAFVLGNEHEGVSEEAREHADKNFLIPMYGMVQSLNVSVSAAICMYEALRQRETKGMYESSEYSQGELKEKLDLYLEKGTRHNTKIKS